MKVFLLFFFLPNKKESFLYVKVEKVHCWTHIGCFLFQFAMKLPRINRAFGFSMRTLSREKKVITTAVAYDQMRKENIHKQSDRARKKNSKTNRKWKGKLNGVANSGKNVRKYLDVCQILGSRPAALDTELLMKIMNEK